MEEFRARFLCFLFLITMVVQGQTAPDEGEEPQEEEEEVACFI